MKIFSGAEITMDDQRRPSHQARAIERWENEGGKVSLPSDLVQISQGLTFRINEKRLEDTVKPNRRRWTRNGSMFPMWRFA
jgi:hypothetical protein